MNIMNKNFSEFFRTWLLIVWWKSGRGANPPATERFFKFQKKISTLKVF